MMFADAIADRAKRVASEVAATLAPAHSAKELTITLLGMLIIDGCLLGAEVPADLATLLDRSPSSSWGRAARATLYSLPHLTIQDAFQEIQSLTPRFTSEFRIAV